MFSHEKCCLCSQVAGNPDHDLISRLLPGVPYERRVAMESKSFAVIPSLGPIVQGHVLLCSKAHLSSFACIGEERNEEFQRLKDSLLGVLRELYRLPVHCFEHGSARNTDRVLCTVDHAHLHLLPVDVSIWGSLRDAAEWISVDATLEELRRNAGDSEYLFYESPEGRAFLARAPASGFESQFLRRVFSAALGRESEWNWRDNPRPVDAHGTFLAVRAGASGRGGVEVCV